MVDLRSDTISMPTREMLGEDLAVNELEDLAAEMTGKEAAVLFPSGTQGNTSAILAYCRPGQKVMVDEMQHIYLSEKVVFAPSIGQLEPVTYKLDQDNLPDLDDMRRILESQEIALLCIENTHNFSGGTCVPLERMNGWSQDVQCSGGPGRGSTGNVQICGFGDVLHLKGAGGAYRFPGMLF